MTRYTDAPEIAYGDDALSADQALARARRALERAELAVDEVAELVDGNDDAVAMQEQAEIAAIRALIGRGWAEMGDALRRAER